MSTVTPTSKTDVFLGGSCNPTVWRKQKAMPYLDKRGISYYNPQVDDWSPELITIENYHKNTASVLLFVIDNLTRGVASCTEAAYYIGKGRKVVIVINKFITDTTLFVDTTTTTTNIQTNEYNDLNRGREYVVDICKQNNIYVHNDLETALLEIDTYIKHQQNMPRTSIFRCFGY